MCQNLISSILFDFEVQEEPLSHDYPDLFIPTSVKNYFLKWANFLSVETDDIDNFNKKDNNELFQKILDKGTPMFDSGSAFRYETHTIRFVTL